MLSGLHHRDRNGAGERNRTVASALARPHSAVEPHPQNMVSPAGLSPTTWRLGRARSVLSYGDEDQTPGRSLSPAKSPRNEAAGATSRSGVQTGTRVR